MISYRDENTEQLIISSSNTSENELFIRNINQAIASSKENNPSLYLDVNNRTLPLYIESANADDFSIYTLLNEGDGASLTYLAELKKEVKSSALYRENRQYVRVVAFDYYGSHRFGDEFLKKTLGEFQFAPGYSIERVNWSWNTEKIRRQYSLVPFILLLIFVICASMFENLKLPLKMILIIPFSFIGVFATFSWGEFYFDQGGYAAFIMLSGITVNATIFIVNEARLIGSKNWNYSVLKSCSRKFIPILLTIISTCLGLIPFLIEGQKEVFWFSFAAGVIGGLIFSLFVVFVVFPVLLMKKPNQSSFGT